MTSSRPGTVPTQTNVPTETQVPSDARDAVDALRQIVADLHGELTRYGLVIWTAGNVSVPRQADGRFWGSGKLGTAGSA